MRPPKRGIASEKRTHRDASLQRHFNPGDFRSPGLTFPPPSSIIQTVSNKTIWRDCFVSQPFRNFPAHRRPSVSRGQRGAAPGAGGGGGGQSGPVRARVGVQPPALPPLPSGGAVGTAPGDQGGAGRQRAGAGGPVRGRRPVQRRARICRHRHRQTPQPVPDAGTAAGGPASG